MARSYLFSPSDTWRKIEKATQSSAEAIIIDLEDSVAPHEKMWGRGTAHKALLELYFGPRLRLLRVNSAASGQLFEDLNQVLKDGVRLEGIVIPKAERPETIQEVSAWLDQHNYKDVAIYPLIESALGLLHVADIAKSSPRLRGLMLGGEDLVASLGARATPERHELAYARGAVVTAATAYGLEAIDAVYLDFKNDAGLRADCETAVQLGFTGKMVIHPRQIDITNQTFAPSEAEIEWAMGLLIAFDHYTAQGKGVFVYDNQMVDEAIVKRARRIVQAKH